MADIELQLASPGDAVFGRMRAERRIQALEEDGEMFGLLPHEEEELDTLRQLLAKHA